MTANQVKRLTIKTFWDGRPLDHDPVELCISSGPDGASIKVDVRAPIFNDPGCPASPAKQPCDELWEYEVVEVFFLGESERYLEVEFCPAPLAYSAFNFIYFSHGQHLVLLLDGQRNKFKDKLAIDYSATIDEKNKTWTGSAVIPMEYFPPSVIKINAFAIHGSGENRQYEALYPASNDFPAPDL
ncbi:hypothetical protein QZH41_016407 [Actinostola sp. cb2023]|nr:hypothetical protein QZH41_016407 [Actinostola sp. cb2023]